MIDYDDDDEYFDVIDDVEDEVVDAEQIYAQNELNNNNGQASQTNVMGASLDVEDSSMISSISHSNEDEFISDDEDSSDSTIDLPASINNENKRMLEVLHKTHEVLAKTRKLVKITRNVSIIHHHIRNEQKSPNNGLVIDMRVSSMFFYTMF